MEAHKSEMEEKMLEIEKEDNYIVFLVAQVAGLSLLDEEDPKSPEPVAGTLLQPSTSCIDPLVWSAW